MLVVSSQLPYSDWIVPNLIPPPHLEPADLVSVFYAWLLRKVEEGGHLKSARDPPLCLFATLALLSSFLSFFTPSSAVSFPSILWNLPSKQL